MLSWPLFVLCLLFLETQGRSTENILEKTLEDVEQLRALVLELKDIVSNQDQRISDLLLSQTIDRARIKTLEDENKTLISEKSCNPCVTSDDGIRKNRTRDAPRKFPSPDVIMYKVSATEKRETETVIAFYAYMSGDFIPGIKHTIPFDTVITNKGNGYHSGTGVFIAPEPGYYVFTWTIRMTRGSQHSLELVVNSSVKGASFMRTNDPEDQTVTGTAVVYVNQNDDVYVRTHGSYVYNAGNIRSDTYSRTSFAGWRLA